MVLPAVGPLQGIHSRGDSAPRVRVRVPLRFRAACFYLSETDPIKKLSVSCLCIMSVLNVFWLHEASRALEGANSTPAAALKLLRSGDH